MLRNQILYISIKINCIQISATYNNYNIISHFHLLLIKYYLEFLQNLFIFYQKKRAKKRIVYDLVNLLEDVLSLSLIYFKNYSNIY